MSVLKAIVLRRFPEVQETEADPTGNPSKSPLAEISKKIVERMGGFQKIASKTIQENEPVVGAEHPKTVLGDMAERRNLRSQDMGARENLRRPSGSTGGVTSHHFPIDGLGEMERENLFPMVQAESKIVIPGNPVESSLDKRLRIYPGTSPYDASVHLNNFIRNGRNPKGHVRNNTDNSSYLDTAEEIVKTAPKESINIAVWNVLLSGFAKERKYQRMFKLFNDMKKRGIRPSSRTYAIMLNNYPSSHDAPEKTLSRATLLYDEAQRHIQQVLSQIAEAKETEGYELSSDRPSSKAASGLPQLDIEAEAAEEMEGLKLDAYTSGNAVAPTNAYLGLLCHFAQFEEMKRVYDAMPKEGPMAPDGKTYTILFEGNIAYNRVGTERGKSARNSASVRTGTRSQDVAKKDKEILFDSQQIWNEIMSREEKITRKAKKQAQQNQRSGARLMDEQESSIIDDRLVVTALRAFMAGTLEDQSYALNEIVPTVYGLSSPGRASSAFAKTTNSSLAVHIDVTERAVETILKLCLATDRPQEGAHYAHQFLNMPKVFVSQLGLTHYNAMLAMFSKLNDAGQCLQLLDTKPDFLQGRGWPRSSWIYALKAAKFAGDWDNFKIAFTRMSRMLPTGTPDAEATKTSIEKGIPVDDQMSSLLLATAASTNRISVVRDALRTFAYCYADRPVATTTDDTDAEYWRRQLVDNAERCMSKVEAAGRDAESGRDVAEEKSWSDLVASLRLARVESKNAPQSGSSNQDDSNPRVRRESPRSSPRQRSDQWRPSNSRRA
ncbi:hypothetical protein QFC19_002704 [Naganishia cerealis]|uniref:Uncharacterized protein n=1 Tax=Naganishia cerealis TaxID=610337 RepID=A0ACC2W7Q2_9TREE|nr:hypothetical protein QFC19_002704 [Naganishia cerealis]